MPGVKGYSDADNRVSMTRRPCSQWQLPSAKSFEKSRFLSPGRFGSSVNLLEVMAQGQMVFEDPLQDKTVDGGAEGDSEVPFVSFLL